MNLSENMSAIDRLLSGAIDMHVHCSPDSLLPRRQDALQLACSARDLGLRAIVLKSRDYVTAPIAYLVNKIVPEVVTIGSVTLDNEVGGLNPSAVVSGARLGAKVVWMPTFSAINSKAKSESIFGFKLSGPGQTVLDAKGKLRPELKEIIKIIKEFDIILASGHLSPREVTVLFEEARAAGLSKLVVTHALQGQLVDNPFTPQEIKQLAENGAFIEHSAWAYMPTTFRADPRLMIDVVSSIGAERCIITTDLGQDYNPPAPEGMRMFIAILLKNGLKEKEIEVMVKTNPARLLGLD